MERIRGREEEGPLYGERAPDSSSDLPPLQDFSVRPLFLGGDAVALYPSMDIVGTPEVVTQAVIDSKVEFKNIDYKRLLIYLFLLLGGQTQTL